MKSGEHKLIPINCSLQIWRCFTWSNIVHECSPLKSKMRFCNALQAKVWSYFWHLPKWVRKKLFLECIGFWYLSLLLCDCANVTNDPGVCFQLSNFVQRWTYSLVASPILDINVYSSVFINISIYSLIVSQPLGKTYGAPHYTFRVSHTVYKYDRLITRNYSNSSNIKTSPEN